MEQRSGAHRSWCWPSVVVLVAVSASLGSVSASSPERKQELVVAVKDRTGKDVGTVRLHETEHGVLVRAELSNLPPGDHAMHIHETGKCEPPFETAGGHLNEQGAKHGFENPHGFHAGDLPNVHVSDTGKATVDAFATKLRLHDGTERLLDGDGAAVVIHAGPDDYRSDPAGAAGDRIACGVIQ